MKTYKTFDSLNGNKLKAGDRVYIAACWWVADTFGFDGLWLAYSNLSICGNQRYQLASVIFNHWGANSIATNPVPPTKDYEAITRLALTLMAFSEGSPYVELLMPDRTWLTLRYKDYIGPMYSRRYMDLRAPGLAGEYTTKLEFTGTGKARLVIGCTEGYIDWWFANWRRNATQSGLDLNWAPYYYERALRLIKLAENLNAASGQKVYDVSYTQKPSGLKVPKY